MKKTEFFTERFLNECDIELLRMMQLIEAQKHTIHPSAMNDEELKVQKIFANRLLTILYHGKAISQKDWLEHLYIIDTLDLDKPTNK